MKIQKLHDKFFKETFGNVETTKNFLIHYLPKRLLNVIDVNSLEVQKDSFINKELQEHFSDLLFKVIICHQEGYLYLLFEHKSYIDETISIQLLKYIVEIWSQKQAKEHTKHLPIIIPIVIYHGKKNWNIPTSLGEFLNGYNQLPKEIKRYVPNYEFLLYDISRYSDEEIKGTAQLKILFTLFRDLNTGDAHRQKEAIFRSIYFLNELENKKTAIGYLETLVHYVFNVVKDFTKDDMKTMIEKIDHTNLKGRDVVMTLADLLRKEGMEIGETKALANTAILLLTKKLGNLPHDLKEMITRANKETLQAILMNIFSIEYVDDVKKYIQ